MATSILSKSQESLLAAYLAGDDVSSELLDACKESPALLEELSALVANGRIMTGELEPLNDATLFSKEVITRIQTREQSALTSHVLRKIGSRKAKQQPWFRSQVAMVASIAAFACFLFIANFVDKQRHIAIITQIAATSVVDNHLKIGDKLGSGSIELSEGYSELTLSNGVILVLEAPVKLTLQSENKVFVDSGKLVAKVPPNAIGFRIDTPSAEIIDLGTEFGVDVLANGDSQVHVLEGEVKARASKLQSYQHLKKDQALAFNHADDIEHIHSNPKEFRRVLPGNSAERPNYLHWSFDEKENNKFLALSNGFDNSEFYAIDQSQKQTPIELLDGVYGRAINFNGNGHWLETNFPGIGNNDPRTVSFWVKVPSDFSTDNAYGIINWGLQENYASWQISPNPEKNNGELGRIRIGTYNAQVVGHTDLRDNQWHHIAVVLYGGETSDVSTHILLYVDGKLEKTQNKSIAKVNTQLDHPKSKPLSLGRNIGYHPNAAHETQNYFKGSVDELFVFEAALSQEQIRRLMKNNTLVE